MSLKIRVKAQVYGPVCFVSYAKDLNTVSGSCWSDEASEGRYNLHGISSQCYDGDIKGKENPTQCPVGSKLCSGGAVANYVYTIINN